MNRLLYTLTVITLTLAATVAAVVPNIHELYAWYWRTFVYVVAS